MKRMLVMAGVVAAAAACVSRPPTAGTEAEQAPAEAPPTVTIALPAGDVGAGRQAFLDLKCTACHAVASEPEFPAPVSVNSGPPIDPGVARSDPSYLAAAIMTPSHAMSANTSPEVRASIEGVLSPMGDFSGVMTVRQMVNLHAYLRSIN